MELSTGGDPVMAICDFSGSDPTPSLTEFQQMVPSHEVYYFVAGAGGGVAGGFGGGAWAAGSPLAASPTTRTAATSARRAPLPEATQITSWIEAHFAAKTLGGTTVYDLTTPAKAS